MHRSAWSTINLDWTNLILGFDYSCIQRSWSWHVSCILSYYLVIAWDQAPQSTPRLTSFADIFPIWPPFLPLSFTAEPCPRLFPVVLCFCRCLWQDLTSDAVYSRTGFSLTSLKPKASMKEPFVTKISVDFLLKSYKRVVVLEFNDFLVPCYVWRKAPKPIKIRHLHDVVIYE